MRASRNLTSLLLAIVVAGCQGTAKATPDTQPVGAVGSPATTTAVQSTSEPSAAALTATPSPSFLPGQAHVLATIDVGDNPAGMLEAFGSVWVVSTSQGNVLRIDPTSHQVTATIQVGGNPLWILSDGAAVWVVDHAGARWLRIDPTTNTSVAIPLPGRIYDAPALGAGAVWEETTNGIAKVDVASRTVVGLIPPTMNSDSGLAYANGQLWVPRDLAGAGGQAQNPAKGIQRIDPKTLKRIDLVDPTLDITAMIGADATSVWVASDTTIDRLDSKTGKIIGTWALPNEVYPGGLSGGQLWLQIGSRDGFSILDLSNGVGPIQTLPGTTTSGLGFLSRGPHELWISDSDAKAIYIVDPAA